MTYGALQLRSKLESSKGDTFSSTVITDFLYGAEDGSELEGSMDEINQFAEVRKWTSKQWTDLLQKYVLSLGAEAYIEASFQILHRLSFCRCPRKAVRQSCEETLG